MPRANWQTVPCPSWRYATRRDSTTSATSTASSRRRKDVLPPTSATTIARQRLLYRKQQVETWHHHVSFFMSQERCFYMPGTMLLVTENYAFGGLKLCFCRLKTMLSRCHRLSKDCKEPALRHEDDGKRQRKSGDMNCSYRRLYIIRCRQKCCKYLFFRTSKPGLPAMS